MTEAQLILDASPRPTGRHGGMSGAEGYRIYKLAALVAIVAGIVFIFAVVSGPA